MKSKSETSNTKRSKTMSKLTDITKAVRAELKEKFPGYTFSVTTQHGLEIIVSLMSAPESPFANLETVNAHTHEGKYAQLNHYHIEQNQDGDWMSNEYYLTEEAAEMFKAVSEIGNRENWDKSDIQTDYFNVNYYFNLAVGKWDKLFVIK